MQHGGEPEATLLLPFALRPEATTLVHTFQQRSVSDGYGGWKSSTTSKLRKTLTTTKQFENSIYKKCCKYTQPNKALQFHNNRCVSRGHQNVLNTAWTLVLLTWFVTHEVIVVGLLYHLFIVFSIILFCKLLCGALCMEFLICSLHLHVLRSVSHRFKIKIKIINEIGNWSKFQGFRKTML